MLTLNRDLAIQIDELITRAAEDESAELKLDCKLAGSRVLCGFDSINELASTIDSLSVVNNGLKDAPIERIQEAAETLAERINYLPEPLRLIECDPTKEAFQLRSDKPVRIPSGLHYFELVVNRRVATLTRFRQPANGRRQIISTIVTHEVLDRLIHDMSDAFK